MPMYTNTCIVPSDGYINTDGYIRVLDKPRSCGGRLKMLHRIEWEKINGSIPDDYEINHKCKNRMCCNVNHLEILTKSDHKSKDNSLRYKEREDQIVAFYMKNEITQQELADTFGVSQPGISKILNRRIVNVS